MEATDPARFAELRAALLRELGVSDRPGVPGRASAFQRRYPFGMSKPFPVPVWPYVRSGYLKRGRTLDVLARTCGIDPAGLTSTVEAFNQQAVVGEDPEFGRGRSAFNRGSGDPTTSRIRHWPRSGKAPSTRSRSSPAASAPSPA
jgi:hypothetical protein